MWIDFIIILLLLLLLLLFLFHFIHSHAWCGWCSIVCLRVQVMQIKQVVFLKKHFLTFLHNWTQKYKATKKCIVRFQLNLNPSTFFRSGRKAIKEVFNFLKLFLGRDWLQLNEKKSVESHTRLMSWYWKQKPTWRKDLLIYISHSWIMFSGYHLERGRGRLKLYVQGQGGKIVLVVSGQGGWGVLKIGQSSWTSYVFSP